MVWYLESLTASIIPNAPLRIKPKLAPAWGAEVVSSNIVGYEKVNLSKGFNMIGTQFLQVGGEPLAIATVGVLDSSMAGFDEDGVYATEMQIWNGNGYDYYGWSGTSAGEYMEDESLNNMWLNGDFKTDDATSTAGQGFWIKAATAGTITLSGEVPSADSARAASAAS